MSIPFWSARLARSPRYRAFHAACDLLTLERRSADRLPLRSRIQALRRGFLSDSAALYGFPASNPNDYISDFGRRARLALANEQGGLFKHKLVLRAFLQAQGFAQPETLAYLSRGRILLHPLSAKARPCSVEELETALREGGSFVVKPEDGGRGKGVQLVETHAGELHVRRGTQVVSFRPFELGPRPILIERRLEQAGFWRDLHPDCANTLRILTLWDPDSETPFIARAAQRIGTRETAPTDNFSGGGISALVDLETGALGPVVMRSRVGSGRRTVERHPDTGARIEGVKLPGWGAIRDFVLQAASRTPFNPYVGWDVLVQADGRVVIVEANATSDIRVLQAHGGLLTDPRVRKFYRRFGGR